MSTPDPAVAGNPALSTPIAIVGMGCRFAGATDLQAYWDLIRSGDNAFGPVPENRWVRDAFVDDSRRATDKSYTDVGGFIDDIRSFPALALGLPPRRVEVMDPQQRLALECALQALEDAGLRGRMPHRTGVYVGVTAQEWRNVLNSRIVVTLAATGAFGDAPADASQLLDSVNHVVPSRPFTAIGVLGNMMAATIAQELDLHGPAYTTDAACASAMMALENAVTHLRIGATDAAVAGGVYLCITPDHHVAFSRIGAMSRSGHCRPFDHRADGFVQGDGGGMVVLKRLADAERHGDRIYAVIHSARTNNDGRGDGPMAPRVEGQAEAVSDAWMDSGMDPARLGYVEAHGTGTAVGDITELTGLRAALQDHVQHAALGSSKANVGHTMSAAAIAGLIKTALAIYHKEIPPLGAFEHAKPELPLKGSGFWIPTQPTPWNENLRLAGVSSFGFGGTNGHAVLAAWQGQADQQASTQVELVCMSASDEGKLRWLAGRTADTIEADPTISLAAVARAWAGRMASPTRLALVCRDRQDLVAKLRAVAAGDRAKGVYLDTPTDAPRIAFMYPGQGSQRPGMLGDLRHRFPIVQATLDRMERALVEDLPLPLSQLLYPEQRTQPVTAEQAQAELTDTAVCQPVLLSAATALTAVLAQVGVHPHVVVGHSLGEFAAAATAGVLSPEDAARFVARRGRAMAKLPGDHGAMAAIMAEEADVRPLLTDGVVIANVNHPRQLVLSGSTQAIDEVLDRAEAADIRAKKLQVSHGFHSPALAELDSASLLAEVVLKAPEITVASGIADHCYADAADARAVFLRHATSPVMYVRALEQCRAAGADVYLQVGAGGPLASFARGSLPRDHRGVLNLASTDDHDGGASLLEGLGRLWTLGAPVDVRAITAPDRVASLPPSILPREDYWAVKDEVQLALKVPGLVTDARSRATPKPSAQTAPVATASMATTQPDDLPTQVRKVIAKVSAYPLAALKPDVGLIDDLGFDSLMVNDLVLGLKDAFPAVEGLPQELLVNRPTVQDIIDFVYSVGQGEAAVHDDDAPLHAWTPVWRDAPLGLLPHRKLKSDARVLVVGLGWDGLLATLDSPQITVSEASLAAQAGPADLILWQAAPNLAEDPSTSLSAHLITALDRQASLGRQPDLLVLRDDSSEQEGRSSGQEAPQESLSGVARSVAAEWPDSRVKVISAAGKISPAALKAELSGMDLTVDVRLGSGRQVMGLEPVQDEGGRTLGSRDVVVITGGTRGIGASLATLLAATQSTQSEAAEGGVKLVLVGRSAPGQAAAALVSSGRAVLAQADVTDAAALASALAPHLPSSSDAHAGRSVVLIHAAGVLADGPLGTVPVDKGRLAVAVKVQGWQNALAIIGDRLAAGVALGSLAGRFGNRHQAWYAAANAALAATVQASSGPDAPCAIAEFGPWVDSEMVASIPAAVQGTMRTGGVEFVGTNAGLAALLDTVGQSGVRVQGRDLPWTTRTVRWTQTLSTQTHPFLLDHAIDGVPVLPLASATDLLATAALPDSAAQAPFEITDLRLYQGVTVREPVTIELSARGDRAELRVGERRSLAYKARVRPLAQRPQVPAAATGGAPASLSLDEFYGGVTFHGPLLQGIVSIDGVGDDFVRGTVRIGQPDAWIPDTRRGRWTVDPLALDSAMQLSAHVAWTRYHRVGTPIGIERYVQLAPLPTTAGGTVSAEVWTGEAEGDRFTGTIVLRDAAGQALVVAEGVAAELVEVDVEAAASFKAQPRQIDFAEWPEVQSMAQRLQAAELIGINNPFFHVHEGTARNTSIIEGREYVNYSSYNYIGLSGDPRVLADVRDAVDRYGTSVSASRVASGERPFHHQLEALLAKCQDTEASLVFTAGHATNVTTVGHLMGPKDLILHDELIHDSALQGIKLAGSTRRSFKHDDAVDLERQLRTLRAGFDRCLIIVEGVYSMDGDVCKLPAFIPLKQRYGCLLMVDEAHSFGILGKTGCGLREHFGIPGRQVDIWMGTLSKSLASCGGWIAGSQALIDYLKYTAPGFVYSAGITPANAVASLSSLRLMLAEPQRVKALQDNAAFFHAELTRHGLDTGPADGESGVIPVVTGNSVHALWLSQRLAEHDVNVQPIVYPAVADDAARLRFFLSSTHTTEQLAWTAQTVKTALAEVREEFPL